MTKDSIEKGYGKLEKLATHEYGMSLAEIIADADETRREKRLWRLTGVLIKQRFSTPVQRRPVRATGARYRWDIDAKQLEKYVARNSWEAKLLGSFQSRRKNEAMVDYGLRLKSETKFGKEFKKLACSWMCNDAETVREIQQFFKQAKLQEYLHLSTSAGLLAALSTELAMKIPNLSGLETGLVIAITFIISTIGLVALCKVSGYWPPATAGAAKRKKVKRAVTP